MKKFLFFIILFIIPFFNVSAAEEYLKDILIDGESLKDFDTKTTTYNLTYEKEKEDINIVFVYDDIFQAQTTGNTGKLNYGENIVKITLIRSDDETKTDKLTYTLNIIREDGRSSENSLTSLTVAGKKVALTEKLEYDVLVDNSLKSAEIKGVLKDLTATFVSGYGERIGSNAVNLNGEKTKVELKVQAENESIKTYTINIIKNDYKNNDATIKKLVIKEIDFNFKSNIYEYDLSVENSVDMINLDVTTNDKNATIEYEKTYNLIEGVNNIVIKVEAEDGSFKEYKLNITRKEEVPLVNDINITGIEFEFEPKTYDYEIETELTTLEFNVTLNSETATSNILDNENLTNGSVVKIEVKDNDKTLTYNFKIVKEEIELNNNESEEEEENNKINEFLKKYEMYIGLGVFGLGVIMLLIAILTRPKKSKIM